MVIREPLDSTLIKFMTKKTRDPDLDPLLSNGSKTREKEDENEVQWKKVQEYIESVCLVSTHTHYSMDC